MTERPRILIVDDEARLRRAVRVSLDAGGFDVDEAGSGEEALEKLRDRSFDLVLLDINMGGQSGIDVCRRLREMKIQSGIVMVTVRDSEHDKVTALEAGADDFVTKPFLVRELLARVRAVLRRTRAAVEPREVLRAGAIAIDLEKRVVTKSDIEVHLSPTEFDVLALLAKARGAPVRHMEILRKVWGPEYGGETEYLRSYIKMLRAKLEDVPGQPKYIITEPWIGYRFQVPAGSEDAADSQ